MKNLVHMLCLSCLLIVNVPFANAQEVKQSNYEYDIMVYERPLSQPLVIERELTTNQKGFFGSLLEIYRTTFTGKVVDFSAQVLQAGINLIVTAINMEKENYNNWQQITQKELKFSKTFPMQNEISDFYQAPSTIGALDPNGIIFKGFGCKQYVVYKDSAQEKKIPVIIVACSLDTSTQGKQRINHHSKFQMLVDSVIFNPFLCNIPNDSLTYKQIVEGMRIPFDFERRKNLRFCLHADVSSSWMNEAIMVTHDQYLGSFDISFNIPDSTVLDASGRWKGYYTWYSTRDQDNPKKKMSITGESFIVPRSFICTKKVGDELISEWGTGQYRIDMALTESCELNTAYYFTDNQPNGNWKQEWKQMKRRKHYPTYWDHVKADFIRTFDIQNHQWVHTLLDPIQNAIVVDEKRWLSTIMGVNSTSSTSSTPAAAPATISTSNGTTPQKP